MLSPTIDSRPVHLWLVTLSSKENSRAGLYPAEGGNLKLLYYQMELLTQREMQLGGTDHLAPRFLHQSQLSVNLSYTS